MMEAIESVVARLDDDGAPVPAAVPGEFVVYLGTDDVPDGLDPDLTALLLTWIEWVEVEVQGIDHFVEELHRLRGAVMVAAVGEW
jgi:hypothetical protein